MRPTIIEMTHRSISIIGGTSYRAYEGPSHYKINRTATNTQSIAQTTSYRPPMERCARSLRPDTGKGQLLCPKVSTSLVDRSQGARPETLKRITSNGRLLCQKASASPANHSQGAPHSSEVASASTADRLQGARPEAAPASPANHS